MQRILLLGQQTPELGSLSSQSLEQAWVGLSPGSDPDSPSKRYKGDLEVPNEDALLILKEGPKWLLAVADGHLGHHCSHALLQHLAHPPASLPARMGQLSMWLANLEWGAEVRGGSTLVVAVADERSGEVFGFSFGDSSVVTLGPQATVQNRLNDFFLQSSMPIPMEHAQPFQFRLEQTQTLLLYSDGINECCYRDPLRSVQLRHLEQLYSTHAHSTAHLGEAVAQLALTGVEGHPGGQDNLAVIAWKSIAPSG